MIGLSSLTKLRTDFHDHMQMIFTDEDTHMLDTYFVLSWSAGHEACTRHEFRIRKVLESITAAYQKKLNELNLTIHLTFCHFLANFAC